MKRLGFNRIMRPLRGFMLRYMPLMITCRQFEDFIIGYLEDDLSRHQRSAFELHLKICGECRDYLAAYKRAVEVAAQSEVAAGADAELPDVPEDLVKAIINARRS